MAQKQQTAIVAGVGPGLGWALVKRFAAAGLQVAMAARTKDKLNALLDQEPIEGIRAYSCDVADQASVEHLFAQVLQDLGAPDSWCSMQARSSAAVYSTSTRRISSAAGVSGVWAAFTLDKRQLA